MPTAVKMPCHATVKGPRCTFGSKGRFSSLAPVTFLVLLARAAPARIVPAELLVRRGRGRDATAALSLRCSWRRHASARRGAIRRERRLGRGLVLLLLLGLLRRLHRDAEDRLGDVVRDLARHLVEEGTGLVLVRHERILLAVAAEVDALAELLHRGEVFDPVRVDRAQQQPPLDGARGLLAERGLAGFVRLVDEVGGLRVEGLA